MFECGVAGEDTMGIPFAGLAASAAFAAVSRQAATRIVGAQLGSKGTIAAMALPFLFRRVSPLGMVAMAAGAWAAGRLMKHTSIATQPVDAAPPAAVTVPPTTEE